MGWNLAQGDSMHPLLNHLVQLQELVLIRGEQQVAGGVEHLERLNESITAMTKQLPKEIRTTFEKLRQRDQNVVVPVADMGCSVCGMKLPRSLIQEIRLGREIKSCPNCARLLYEPEGVSRNIRKRPGRFEVPKPGVARFSAETLMLPSLAATDKESAIRELATRLADEGFVDRADRLVEEALRREAVLCTAVDHGLAFPHVRGVEGGGLTLAVGLSRNGIAFDGPTGELTQMIFFIVIPTAASAFYLKLLAGLTEAFMAADARKQLLAAEDQLTMWKTLIKISRKTIK
jgi:mannitol/fructose-specific phosphotransferase system IIA component (Ntr-type)